MRIFMSQVGEHVRCPGCNGTVDTSLEIKTGAQRRAEQAVDDEAEGRQQAVLKREARRKRAEGRPQYQGLLVAGPLCRALAVVFVFVGVLAGGVAFRLGAMALGAMYALGVVFGVIWLLVVADVAEGLRRRFRAADEADWRAKKEDDKSENGA